MRKAILLLSIILMSNAAPAADSQPEEPELCQFNLTGEPAQPVITGPQEVASRTHIVTQDDSPVQVTALDLEGSWISLTHDRYADKLCYRAKLRNYSDQSIRDVRFLAHLVVRSVRGGTGGNLHSRSGGLHPNEETEFVEVCGSGGGGTPGGDDYKLLIYVESVEFDTCTYYPSLRLPHNLGHLPRAISAGKPRAAKRAD